MTKHPMESHLLTIVNHFGVENQFDKLDEEMLELNQAHENLYYSGDKEVFIEYLKELSDCMILAKQLAVKKHNIPLEEIAAMQPSKIARTIDIIIKSDKSKDPVQEYNRIRRGND